MAGQSDKHPTAKQAVLTLGFVSRLLIRNSSCRTFLMVGDASIFRYNYLFWTQLMEHEINIGTPTYQQEHMNYQLYEKLE